MSNFTDLEDAIMTCWAVADDLRAFAEYASDERTTKLLTSLADVYDFKMERLNDISELCLKDYYELKHPTTADLPWGDEASEGRVDIIGSNGNIGYGPMGQES